ncbi:Ribose 5-phosphate isomerase B [Bacillus badius]|nr:Ribose 5-phosphate isomerase B [Bacillus badius]
MIGTKGAQTPAGAAGQGRPRRRFWRRGGSPPAPRKAKRLEWKATEPIHKKIKRRLIFTQPLDDGKVLPFQTNIARRLPSSFALC